MDRWTDGQMGRHQEALATGSEREEGLPLEPGCRVRWFTGLVSEFEVNRTHMVFRNSSCQSWQLELRVQPRQPWGVEDRERVAEGMEVRLGLCATANE